MTRPYREGIVAVLRDHAGRVLVGERSDGVGAWQFPQGGVEPGETREQAFHREVREELGVAAARVLERGGTLVRYEWPRPGRDGKLGQEQEWFLGELAHGAEPALESSDGVFRAWRWVDADEAVALVVGWKRPAYRAGLASLGIRLGDERGP